MYKEMSLEEIETRAAFTAGGWWLFPRPPQSCGCRRRCGCSVTPPPCGGGYGTGY